MFAGLTLASCLKKMDLMLTTHLDVSGSEDETLYFSTVSAAVFDVEARGGEELRRLEIKTIPTCSWNDTVIAFKMSRGHIMLSKDSVYKIFFSLMTDFDTVDVRRYIKFRYIFPDVDSFDVHVGSKPSDDCLIDVEGKAVYPFTQYINRRYDLVFVNELRSSFWGYGTCLASPNAPAVRTYFADKIPELPYRDTLGHTHKETLCGYVPNDHGEDWSDFSNTMLGMDDNWQFPMYINYDNKLGYGVSNLQPGSLYKFRLQNGRYVMVKVLAQQNVGFPDCQVDLRIFYQK